MGKPHVDRLPVRAAEHPHDVEEHRHRAVAGLLVGLQVGSTTSKLNSARSPCRRVVTAPRTCRCVLRTRLRSAVSTSGECRVTNLTSPSQDMRPLCPRRSPICLHPVRAMQRLKRRPRAGVGDRVVQSSKTFRSKPASATIAAGSAPRSLRIAGNSTRTRLGQCRPPGEASPHDRANPTWLLCLISCEDFAHLSENVDPMSGNVKRAPEPCP